MGTPFIAARESMAVEAYKRTLVARELDNVMPASAFTGLPSSILRSSIEEAGLDPAALPSRGMIDPSTDIIPGTRPKRWKDI